jgi:serine protease AprX
MNRIHRQLVFALALILSLATGARVPIEAKGAQASRHRVSRLDTALRAALDDAAAGPQRVIVRVRPERRAAVRDGLAAHGDQILSEHASLDALTAVVHRDDLAALADNDAVLSVSADAIVRPHSLLGGIGGLLGGVVNLVLNVAVDLVLDNGADTSGPVPAPVLVRQTLGVDSTSWTGKGVGVAVIDSGLELSTDLPSTRVTKFYDFTNGQTAEKAPFDDYGHGTHIAGTIGGSGAMSSNAAYRGLAPKVKFVVLKVLDKNGAGYTSDVMRAIDFVVANKAALGVDIINLSLGHPIYEPAASDPLVLAVERATRAGIIVVAAAGNNGKKADGTPAYAGINSPGNAPSAITVGAVNIEGTLTRSDDRIPGYSSSGPTWYDSFAKPDIVSPGHNIVAVAAKKGYLYQTYPQLKADNTNYMFLSGTSMATAVTTGSIALLVEANRYVNAYPQRPSLTPNTVKAILEYTSVGIHDDAGVEYDSLRKGVGSINPKGAIDLAKTINTAMPTGSGWLTSTPSPWTKIGDDNLHWSQSVLWGNMILWGTAVDVNQTAWGSMILWGTDTTWSNMILWGTTDVVWTDPQSWANTIVWGSDSIGYDSGTMILWGTTTGLTADTTAWKDLGGGTQATGQ